MLFAGRGVRLTLQVLVAFAVARSMALIVSYFLGLQTRRHHVEASLFILAVAALACWRLLPHAADLPHGSPDRRRTAVDVAAAAGAFVLYWPALSVGLLSDDFVLVDRALRGEFVAPHHEFVRPVPLVLWSIMLACRAGPAALHFLNLTLHAANAVLTARLGRWLGLTPLQALAAAGLFLAWPTQVEPVAWASGVFDVLMTTAVLAVLLLYVANAGRLTAGRTAALLLISITALLSKETAVVLPALIAAISAPRWMRERPARHELHVFAALTALCAGYLIWRVFLRSPAGGDALPSLTAYLIKEQISRTFATLAAPFTLERIASAPLVAAAVSSGLLALLVLPVVLRRERTSGDRRVVTGLVWCFTATAPALGYLFIGPYLEGSRYLYLALSGWAIAMASRIGAGGWPRWMPASAVAVVALLCVAQGRAVLDDWRQAGRERDAILSQAREASAGCANPTFSGLPDRYRAAQLFRNGFPEALGRASPGAQTGRDAGCEFEWDGSGFRRP